MLLSQLLPQEFPLSYDRNVTGLNLDSRVVRQGEVFFALAGTQTHGEIYIESALQKGAIAIFKETKAPGFEILSNNIPCIHIPHLSQQVGEIAARFYDEPSRRMKVIGVTGTNGKTSITHAIANLLQAHVPCGLLGTLGYGIYGALQPGAHTTPDAIRLQALLAQLKTQEVQYLAMEVSSHALAQGRVNGIIFDTAVFTNLSRDHLDYHQTMAEYGKAKQRLFTMPGLKTAIINSDDAFGQTILAALPKTVTPLTYSLHDKNADIYAKIHNLDTQGTTLDIYTPFGNGQGKSPWFGQFNVSNLLATLTVLLNLGFPLPQLLSQLTNLRSVPGRMERLGQPHQPTIIVDYAHTPDALEKALLALQAHLKGTGERRKEKGRRGQDKGERGKEKGITDIHSKREIETTESPDTTSFPLSPFTFPLLWCVFGCGGDRDRGKRRLMGEVAQRYADKIIITDDNPRHESSQTIIDEILQGCPNPTKVIADREQAIRYAVQNAKPGDVVLIAGKGHEDYQQIGEKRLPFSDRTLVNSLLIQS
jgi:UDP-N-acetylmuramoyl-L-alanyl-D-glutamate--2,6-diaminopimelate ligase